MPGALQLRELGGRLGQEWNRPAVRLAAGYVGILLLLSLIFSVIFFNFADAQLARGLGRQYQQFGGFGGGPGGFGGGPLPAIVQSNLDTARQALIWNLAWFNLAVLVVGAGLSYWLARRTLRPIEEALESQARFAADASHELRTPLAVMQTEIETARADPHLSRADAVALLDSNLDEVKKLHSLSNTLLKLARSESGSVALGPVELSEVAAAAIARLAGAAQAGRISLINDTAPVTATGDRDTLVELAAILLDNAIKYSPAGSRVTVATAKSAHHASLSVKDDGPGIAAADLPHIFDRFYRADKSRTGGDTSGHGLGLSLASHLAEHVRGEIIATSRLGHGARFTVKLARHTTSV